MERDFDYLAVRFGQIAEGVNRGVYFITDTAARQALYYLAYNTPVDVGTARSNWIVDTTGVGRQRLAFHPFRSRWKPIPGKYPGGPRGETSNLNAVLRSGSGTFIRRKPDQDIYITNSLPYIVPLNQGHSPRVVRGWVRRSVSEATKAAAADAVRILRREIK